MKYEFQVNVSEIIHYEIVVKAKDESEAIDLAEEEIGSNMVVTTDSSSPDRAVVFGTFYTNFSINKARFESINFPNVQNHGNVVKEFLDLKNQSWPYCTNFDNVLKEFITWQDLVDWNKDCTVGIRLHNFYLFKDDLLLRIFKIDFYYAILLLIPWEFIFLIP